MQEINRSRNEEGRFENADLVDWFLAIDSCLGLAEYIKRIAADAVDKKGYI